MNNWIQKYGKVTGLAASVLLASGSFSLPAGILARWTAAAILLLTLPLLWQSAAPMFSKSIDRRLTGWHETLWRYLPYIIVTVATLLALGPVALGEMPVSQDHANHYFSTHILVNDMILSGRFFGWTDRLGTGYPFGDIYPTACYLVTALLHLLSFKTIDLSTSYAFGIVLAWLLPALATVAWTRRLAGPWGAVLAGLAFVLDAGGDREGGWIYSMFHGVWPQQLGVGVWLFALLTLWRFAEKATSRRLAACVLISGLCMWIHPMNALTLPIAGILMFSVRLLSPQSDPASGVQRGAIRLIIALSAAGIIGLVWVARMMDAGDVVYAYPAYWLSISSLLGKLFNDGGLFDRQIILISGLAIVGVVRVLRRGGQFGIYAFILPAVLILIGSMDLIVGSDLGLVGNKFGIMQYRRFSIPAKPLWYALAGIGFSTLGRGLAAEAKGIIWRTTDHLAGRALVAIILSPFVWGLVQAAPGVVKNPVARPLTLERTGDAHRVAAIRQVLEKEKKRCEPAFCKAVYWEKSGHGGLYPLPAMADAGYGFLPTGRLPANNFKWLNPTKNVNIMARLGASVVISKWKQEHSLLEKIKTFGRHRVYRVKSKIPRQIELLGSGTAEIKSWKPERRSVEISDSDDSTRLMFYMPPYKKWHASQAGEPLEILLSKENGLNLLEVVDVDDGEIVLKYKDGVIENVFFIVGMALILACIVGLIARSRPLPSPLNEKKLARAYSLLPVALGLLAVSLTCALTFGGHTAAKKEWLAGEHSKTKLLAVLHRQGLTDVSFHPRSFCVKPYVRDPEWNCSEHSLEPEIIPIKKRFGRIPSCLAVGVPPAGRTEMTFDLPSGTTRIKGRFHLLSGKQVTGHMTLNPGPSDELIPISQASRKGAFFQSEIQANAEYVTFVFKSEKQARVCIEAVALSDSSK
ncbi:MAG: hypothetical protein GY847_10720 [Proteobacteria bacterium]|nr:hypothetical protein [Pseudomonadota bacterium]